MTANQLQPFKPVAWTEVFLSSGLRVDGNLKLLYTDIRRLPGDCLDIRDLAEPACSVRVGRALLAANTVLGPDVNTHSEPLIVSEVDVTSLVKTFALMS
jgi:hypothetical protein